MRIFNYEIQLLNSGEFERRTLKIESETKRESLVHLFRKMLEIEKNPRISIKGFDFYGAYTFKKDKAV